MSYFRSTLALVCSKSTFLAGMLAAFTGMALSQDSFMMHYTPSELDGYLVNRGDFNNDGIPDIIVGNNTGTSGYGIFGIVGQR